jgi:hypothetical protein
MLDPTPVPGQRLTLPLDLGNGVTGVARGVSPSGMYVTVEGEHQLSGALVLEMQLPDTAIKLVAEGEVVRLERLAGGTGIVVSFSELRLEPLDGVKPMAQPDRQQQRGPA